MQLRLSPSPVYLKVRKVDMESNDRELFFEQAQIVVRVILDLIKHGSESTAIQQEIEHLRALSHYFGFDTIDPVLLLLDGELESIQKSNENRIESETAQRLSDYLAQQFAFFESHTYPDSAAVSKMTSAAQTVFAQVAIPKSETTNRFHIIIKPSKNIFSTSLDMLGILQSIRKLGKTDIRALKDGIPSLELIDPNLNYTGWDIELETQHGKEELQDVLIFLEYDEGGELTLEQLNDATPVKITVEPVAVTQSGVFQEALPKNQATPEKPSQSASTSTVKDDSTSTIRVSSSKLDKIVDLVGEMVTAQAKLAQYANLTKNPDIEMLSEEIERLTNELRDNSMSLRMVPVGMLFKRFVRLVRDLSLELNKEIDLVLEGEETEFDKNVIEKLYDPIVHLIRNSIDHGLESGEERIQAGKPRKGKIVLSAMQSGPDIMIKLSDDGKGLDTEKIRVKAIEKGLIDENQKLTDRQINNLIFLAGFSTNENVSSISGRGVGMDVVKSNVESLRGSVDLSTIKGSGMTVSMRFPLTLAIIDGLLITLKDDIYAIPLSFVEECIELEKEMIETHQSQGIINLRGNVVPIVRLKEFFSMEESENADEKIVVVRDDDEKKIGLVVDSIIGQYQTVIKPLGTLYRERQELAGATILGDGTVALIIDVPHLIQSVASEMNK